MKIIKRTLKIILLIMIIISIYVLYTGYSVFMYGKVYEEKDCDTGIILGAAAYETGVSEVYKQRLNHGKVLYDLGVIKSILVTGGTGEGNNKSDGEIAKEYLISIGMDEDKIIVEDKSSNTVGNIKNAKDILEELGLKNALIISDPLHMKRAMKIAKDNKLEAYPCPTITSAYKSKGKKIEFIIRETFSYIYYLLLKK